MSIPHTGSFTTVVLVILISPSFVTFRSPAGQMLIGRFQKLVPHWTASSSSGKRQCSALVQRLAIVVPLLLSKSDRRRPANRMYPQTAELRRIPDATPHDFALRLAEVQNVPWNPNPI